MSFRRSASSGRRNLKSGSYYRFLTRVNSDSSPSDPYREMTNTVIARSIAARQSFDRIIKGFCHPDQSGFRMTGCTLSLLEMLCDSGQQYYTILFNAWSKSAINSSASSIPTESRTRPSVICASKRCSRGIIAWVIEAGC